MLGYLLAALIGVSLGALGGGGSILTVPIFVYVMGIPAKQAIAMSLPVVGATSLVGAVRHWGHGNFDLRTGTAFAALAMAGSFTGARLATHVSGIVQLTLLGLVMVAAATMMLRHRPPDVPAEAPDGAPRRRAGRFALVGVIGFAVGVLTGLVGVGGGFLFVPALVLLARLPMKTAVGTSLFMIALNTAAGSIGYHGRVQVAWGVVAVFTAIATVGIFIGTALARRVSHHDLRRAFAYFLFVMAAFILYQNRAVIANPAAALRPSNAGVH